MQVSCLTRDTEAFNKFLGSNVHEQLMKPRNVNSRED